MGVPRSTYRLQLQPAFGFDRVAEVADYLAALGISHVYCSPYLQAMPGSTHGYDVLDHHRASAELGGTFGHERMYRALAAAGLGQVIDVVPNHMSIGSAENRWWWDVLENGQASRFAAYFDVDWHPPEERLHDVVVLPVLGDHFGRVLERFEIKLVRDGGTFHFQYHDHRFPVAPRSLNDLLAAAAEAGQNDELAFLATSHGRLPISTATDRRSVNIRHRDKEVLRRLLDRLCRDQPDVAEAIDRTVTTINGDPEMLRALLDRQNYRLTFWRTAGEEMGYRRFFDINSLASLRMEDEQVFEDTHWLILRWVEQGLVDGLRIDHPDGLFDPEEYLRRLRSQAPDKWLVVEKILEPQECLPANWLIHGTTGYDFLNRLGGLLVDPAGADPLTSFYQEFTGESVDYLQVVHDKKHQVLRELFANDVHRLAELLVRICERNARYRDFTRRELRNVVREIIACFPVYRTYIRAAQGQITETDARRIEQAVAAARSHRADIDPDLFDFVRDVLLLKLTGETESTFVMRFQQVTGPVMAKGVEDTVFYNYNRLLCLNEVGGDPNRLGYSLEEFHAACRETQRLWPESMLATTTHDTKRSEDVRARLALLSEIPQAWREAVQGWAGHNQRHKRGEWPDRNFEYAMYQMLVGAWPLTVERAVARAIKGVREAKRHTSWIEHNPEYEESVTQFLQAVLADRQFLARLEAFVRPLVPLGRVNSLTQALVKLTSPGVPDIYQGNELWDLSLVDPDNRRLVDFDLRRQLLAEVATLSPEQILARSDEGLPKLWVTRQALHLRREHPEWFGRQGHYEPIAAAGHRGDCLIAFQRAGSCLTVAPLRVARSLSDWRDTTLPLPAGNWTNILTGERWSELTLRVGQLLARFPVALLVRQAAMP
jgi:(1->4)-alpha-D-glucan 1-alpha-D-glucosylmutase